MNKQNNLTHTVIKQRLNLKPVGKPLCAGVFQGNRCLYEGTYALCTLYKQNYAPKATVRNVYR